MVHIKCFLKYYSQAFISKLKSWILFFIIFLFFKNLNIDFARRIVKECNFLHVTDLSFDERSAKYYHFSLHFHKTVVSK